MPFDIDTIVRSVKKTNRALVIDEDYLTCGVGGEIAMQIMEHAFDYLDGPIKRIRRRDGCRQPRWTSWCFPHCQEITDAITSLVGSEHVAFDVEAGLPRSR